MGEAGEKKCSLHSQQAEATLDRNVPQHPRREKKETFKINGVDLKLNLGAISERKEEEQ